MVFDRYPSHIQDFRNILDRSSGCVGHRLFRTNRAYRFPNFDISKQTIFRDDMKLFGALWGIQN